MTISSSIGDPGPYQKTIRSAFLNYLRSKYEMHTGAARVESRPTLEPSDACQLSPLRIHMNSLHDFNVIGRFQRVWQGINPLLDQAFTLLCQTRYGMTAAALLPSNEFRPPEELLEMDNPRQTADFVEFYEQRLAVAGSPGN